MIKIVRGVYGHYVTDPKSGKTRVVARDSRSEPFELTPEQEARLVSQGVARYVDKAETGEEPIGFDELPPDVGAIENAAHLDAEQLEAMTNAKLKELAEDMGIDTKKLTTKSKLIEAITDAAVIPGESEDGGEDAPTFDAAEAVQ